MGQNARAVRQTSVEDLFTDAIWYAEKGFAVSEAIQEQWAEESSITRLRRDAESARVFLPLGRAPDVGEIFRNPDLEIGRASCRERVCVPV